MKVKLDENLPEQARLAAGSLGHAVDTVIDEGLVASVIEAPSERGDRPGVDAGAIGESSAS